MVTPGYVCRSASKNHQARFVAQHKILCEVEDELQKSIDDAKSLFAARDELIKAEEKMRRRKLLQNTVRAAVGTLPCLNIVRVPTLTSIFPVRHRGTILAPRIRHPYRDRRHGPLFRRRYPRSCPSRRRRAHPGDSRARRGPPEEARGQDCRGQASEGQPRGDEGARGGGAEDSQRLPAHRPHGERAGCQEDRRSRFRPVMRRLRVDRNLVRLYTRNGSDVRPRSCVSVLQGGLRA